MRILATVSFLILTPLAWGQNGFTIDSFTVTPTMESIGVVLNFSGDDNENSSATLEYKETSSGTWLDAHAPVVDHRTGIAAGYQNEVRGSIVGLTENTSYDVRMTITDSDGVTGTNPQTDTVSTRTWTVPVTGSTVYVDGDQASEGDGTSGNPYKTISNAVTQLAGGGTILVRDSATDYASLSVSTNGTASNYIYIKADTGHTPQIDGASTSVISGNYIALDGLTMEVSANSTISVTGDYCYFLNLDFPDISTGASATESGIEIGAVTGCFIQGNTFATDNTDNLISAIDITTESSSLIVIDNNTATGTFRDVIGNQAAPDDTDISNNTLTHSSGGDDALEFEGSGVNGRIWGNTLNGGTSNLAIVSHGVGPLYIFRNYFDGAPSTGSIKHGGGNDGYVFFYHNSANTTTTFYQSNAGGAGNTNVVFKNNVINSGLKVWLGMDTDASNDIDYNSWGRSIDGTIRFTIGSGETPTYDSVALLVAGTAFEDNGVEEDQVYSSGFNLNAGALAVDTALAINNFNGTVAWPNSGAGPDMGAIEVVVGSAYTGQLKLNASGSRPSLSGGAPFKLD